MQTVLFTDSPLIAAGFTACVSVLERCEIVAVINNAQDLFRAVGEINPDLVIFDFSAEENLQTLAALCEQAPQQKVLLWAYAISAETAYLAMRLGIRGILRKTEPLELIVKCLDRLAAGEVWFGQELTRGFLEAKAIDLTPRESELVLLVARGLKNKEIATCLSLSVATVRIYLSTLFRKLAIKDRYELALYGMRNLAQMDGLTQTSFSAPLRRYASVMLLDGQKTLPADAMLAPKVRQSPKLGSPVRGRLLTM